MSTHNIYFHGEIRKYHCSVVEKVLSEAIVFIRSKFARFC